MNWPFKREGFNYLVTAWKKVSNKEEAGCFTQLSSLYVLQSQEINTYYYTTKVWIRKINFSTQF